MGRTLAFASWDESQHPRDKGGRFEGSVTESKQGEPTQVHSKTFNTQKEAQQFVTKMRGIRKLANPTATLKGSVKPVIETPAPKPDAETNTPKPDAEFKVGETRPATDSEVAEFVEDTDAQTPNPDQVRAGAWNWEYGRVSLSQIDVSSTPGKVLMADEKDILGKLRAVYSNHEGSLKEETDHMMKMTNVPAEKLPPVILVRGEKTYSVLDGYHRIPAANLRGDTSVMAYIAVDK